MGRASRMKRLRHQSVVMNVGGDFPTFQVEVGGMEQAAEMMMEAAGPFCRRCGGENALATCEIGGEVKMFFGCPICDEETAERYRLEGHC